MIRKWREKSELAKSDKRDWGLSRRDGVRGSTIVEAAIVLPVLLLVVLGTVEIGMAFKDFLTVGALSREGARIAALAGNDGEADCAILVGIGGLATTADLAKLGEITIFQASPGTGQSTGLENTAEYVGGDPSDCEYQTPDGSESWQISPKTYDPFGRNTTVGATDLELIGVRITVTHQWITGFPPFRGSFIIDESTITRVEPELFEG